jgi:hypothetical protein
MKMKALVITFMVLLLVVPASVNASSVIFDDVNGVYDGALREFTFDIVLGDIGPLVDVDGWNLVFDITRQGSAATFSFTFDPAVPTYANYVLGSSFDYGVTITPDVASSAAFNFFGGDTTTDGSGTYNPGGVLARLTLDDVDPLDLFDIVLDGANSFLFDSNFDIDSITTLGAEVQVVPIPAAAWLLGSGLLALVGLRRKLS